LFESTPQDGRIIVDSPTGPSTEPAGDAVQAVQAARDNGTLDSSGFVEPGPVAAVEPPVAGGADRAVQEIAAAPLAATTGTPLGPLRRAAATWPTRNKVVVVFAILLVALEAALHARRMRA
jgi:hypothetical protein